MGKDKYLMSSLYNALKILDLLSEHDELGVTEISKTLDIGKASVFKMLYTFEKKKYVTKTQNSKYKLGVRFVDYGSIILERQNILELAKPFIQTLRDEHNETTHLGVLGEDLNIVFMLKEASTASIQMASRVGSIMPFYATASGKVLVAHNLDEETKNKISSYDFTQFTKNTITDYEELNDQFKQIKEQGYGEDLEEYELGLTCYAAPVKDASGNAVAAISVSGPTRRMERNKEQLIESLKKTASKLSKTLGYRF